MKNIILSGSTGFIGSNIKKMLTYKKNIILDSINLRNSTKSIKKTLKNKVYDTFIHAAGPHPHRDQLENKEILKENRQLLEKIESIFTKI